MRFWKQTAVLLIAGWAHSVSMAWPFALEISVLGIQPGQALWWLQLLSLAVLARAVSTSASVGRAAGLAWVFSVAWMCGTMWWLYISMHTYGGLPAWLAAFAVFVLGASLALFYTLVCMLFRRLAGVNRAWTALLFAACWLLAELARGTWLTGFPWGAAGYAHVQGPLSGLAPYVGVYGMSFVSAFVAMAGVQLLTKANDAKNVKTAKVLRFQGVVVIVVLVCATWLSSQDKVAAVALPVDAASPGLTTPLDVTLLQGNIPQDEKFQPGTGVADALKWYAEQLQVAKTSLVITPETALPMLPQQLPPNYWATLRQQFASGQQAALIGIPMGNRSEGYSNAVLGLKPGAGAHAALASPYRYDKHHLVPFGEFIPPFAQWFIDLMQIPLGSFKRGDLNPPSFDWQGQRLGLNICYEDLFGEELAQRFKDPATAPTILVNLSNIAWFGNTVAIDQHLNIARLRSMELARPSVRATNTGATVIIDARGQVTQSLARHTRGALVGQVQGRTEITPYAWVVARFWLWPLWLFALLCLTPFAPLARRMPP